MKKAIFIIILGVFGATLFSCEPSELEVLIPMNSTVGEDGDTGEEVSGNLLGDTVGEDGDIEEEEDASGNLVGDTVGEDGDTGEEEGDSGDD